MIIKIDYNKDKLEELLAGLYEVAESAQWWLDQIDRYEKDKEYYKEIADKMTRNSKKFTKKFDEALRLLKLNQVAAYEEVKKAYRKMASEVHPDKGGSEKEMQKVNEAFEIIKEYKQWKVR